MRDLKDTYSFKVLGMSQEKYIPFLLSSATDRKRDRVSERNWEGEWEIEKRKRNEMI